MTIRTLLRTSPLHAFTLVELLLVLVILGILAAIVVPKFAGRTEEQIDDDLDRHREGEDREQVAPLNCAVQVRGIVSQARNEGEAHPYGLSD